MKKFLGHSFHIPVLGVGYSVDTPLKVAKYGISSVISLVDDGLMENLRKKISENYNEIYIPINTKEPDSRSKRITAYLNLLNTCVKKQFEELRNSSFEKDGGIKKYLDMLPDYSELKKKYKEMLAQTDLNLKKSLEKWIRENLQPGSIDVNIMTKVDKENTDSDGHTLPTEFNDAHAALRGFAMSELESSIIFSAGMSPRLYGYTEVFKDFLPNSLGEFKKKIVIKVSDFRSALIQGKYLAKKGLWVSEFRIESGLNCGGHAFATDGYLLGPILEEFKTKRNELLNSLKEILHPALKKKDIDVDLEKLNIKVTVQGGVGKVTEQNFLLRHYDVDSVGWGSPFLLVPETTNVDEYTLKLLADAGEDDLYLSNISPLGVPFNSVRRNSKDLEKLKRIEDGKPGSPCPKKFLTFRNKLSETPICTASLAYIKKVIGLNDNPETSSEFQKEYDNTLDKVCLCEGLTASAIITNELENSKQSLAVSVCPGPNLAYFSKIASLSEMVDHIYGRINLITNENRPNMFIKELDLYINYLRGKLSEKVNDVSKQTEEYFQTFKKNISEEIEYYKGLIPNLTEETEKVREKIKRDLEDLEQKFYNLFAPNV